MDIVAKVPIAICVDLLLESSTYDLWYLVYDPVVS